MKALNDEFDCFTPEEAIEFWCDAHGYNVNEFYRLDYTYSKRMRKFMYKFVAFKSRNWKYPVVIQRIRWDGKPINKRFKLSVEKALETVW